MRLTALLALTLLAACATTPDTAHTGVPRSTITSYDVTGGWVDRPASAGDVWRR